MRYLSSQSASRKIILPIILVGVFVVAQLLANAHASTHLFHAADSSCIILSSAENHSPHGLIPLRLPAAKKYSLIKHAAVSSNPLPGTLEAYRTRAPPF